MFRLRPQTIRLLKIGAFVGVTAWVALVIAGLVWVNRSPIVKASVVRKVERAVGVEPRDPFEGQSQLTLLFLGCDSDLSRGGKKVLKKYARSDMMLVARLDFKAKEVTGLSIPRDTEVAAGRYGPQKINAYHAFGGPDLAKTAVETVLPGVKIDRVVLLDFDAFQEMVDLVGGVEIDVLKRMKWTDRAAKLYIDLKPGKQRLDGYNAMGFVRFRHTDSDIFRTERQRQFMLAFKVAAFKQPWKFPEVVDKAASVLNGALTAEELAALFEFGQTLGNDAIQFGVLPTVQGQGYNLSVDHSKLEATLKEYRLIGAGSLQP